MRFNREMVKARRNEMGYSMQEVADTIKTCVANICRIEKGITRKPRKDTIRRLFAVLELDESLAFTEE